MAVAIGYRKLDLSAGVSYIREHEFNDVIAAHGGGGLLWKYDGSPTTYKPNKKVLFKNLDRMRLESEQEFWTFMEEVQRADVKPPTSPAGVFIECAKRCGITWRTFSPKSPFYGRKFGPWIEQLFRGGEYASPVFLYDINQAYRWSGSVGLPDLTTAKRTKNFRKPHAIYVVRNIKPFSPVPADKLVDGSIVMTSEERDSYGIDSADVIHGVEFRNERIDLQPVFDLIDSLFPSQAKSIGQSYWGMWATTKPVQQIGLQSGSTRELRNLYYNPVWAAFVTGRVKQTCWRKRDTTLRVYCDSIMSTETVPTGTEPGNWKLVKEFRAGLRFRGMRYYPINPAEGAAPWSSRRRSESEVVPF